MTVLESGRECQIFIVHQPPPNSRFNERHSKADNKMEGKFQKTLDEDLWLPRAHLHKHRELGTSGPWDRGEKCRARARNLSVSMPCRINTVICSIPFCKRRRLTCGQERQPEFNVIQKTMNQFAGPGRKGGVWTCILERSLANAWRVTGNVFWDVGKGRVNGCRHTGKLTHARMEEGRGLGKLPRPQLSLLHCYQPFSVFSCFPFSTNRALTS